MTRRGLSLCVVACAIATLAGASSASATPSFAVGGLQNPATQGALELTVLASESAPNARLTTATALVDGAFADEAPFVDGATTVALAVPTTTVGPHTLTVIVRNDLGEAAESSHDFDVAEPPVWTPVVTVSVGSGTILPSPPPGGGGAPPPSGDRGCAAPRLSMFLAQSPLRFRRGVLVLAAGRRYRFAGRLTCRIDGRRRSAPRGTEVQVLHRTRWRTMVKPSLAVRGDGRIAARLAFASRRIVIFRVRGADGSFVRVQIPIRVAARMKGLA